MKALVVLSIAVFLLGAGCSSPTSYWYHPERTVEEAKADLLECRDQARQTAADMITDQHYNRVPPPTDLSAPKGLPREPVQPAADPRDLQKAWRERYEQSVLADCMRRRGYIKAGADRIPRGTRTGKLGNHAVAGQ